MLYFENSYTIDVSFRTFLSKAMISESYFKLCARLRLLDKNPLIFQKNL
ncbi:unnamed protein product [Larinioides sclopetarius]|uniref:Ribosomal protein L32 n=1 Tax=Larinioides sclopetarius TaxID=280406 RepID=A0AAV2AUM1_9ARAC